MVPQWKLDLQPATYNGTMFHVDVNTRAGGRPESGISAVTVSQQTQKE
jgi:hypothetical protein